MTSPSPLGEFADDVGFAALVDDLGLSAEKHLLEACEFLFRERVEEDPAAVHDQAAHLGLDLLWGLGHGVRVVDLGGGVTVGGVGVPG